MVTKQNNYCIGKVFSPISSKMYFSLRNGLIFKRYSVIYSWLHQLMFYIKTPGFWPLTGPTIFIFSTVCREAGFFFLACWMEFQLYIIVQQITIQLHIHVLHLHYTKILNTCHHTQVNKCKAVMERISLLYESRYDENMMWGPSNGTTSKFPMGLFFW